MEDFSQVTTFFANVGVPAILIAFALLCARDGLGHLTKVLVSVTVAHFGFIAFCTTLNVHVHDVTPVVGTMTTGYFFTVARDLVAAPIARTWIGFANYAPFAHDQIHTALRWMIGGTTA